MIVLPHSDYFVDIEVKHDFMSHKFKLFLYALDENTMKYEKVAASEWFNENSADDVGTLAQEALDTKDGDKSMV